MMTNENENKVMSKEVFAMVVKSIIKNTKGVEAEDIQMNKPGRSYSGLSIRTGNVGGVIDIDAIYKKYQDTGDFSNVIDAVLGSVDSIMTHEPEIDKATEKLHEYSMQDFIHKMRLCIMPIKGNEAFIENAVYEEVADGIVIAACAQFKVDEDRVANVYITKKMLEDEGMDYDWFMRKAKMQAAINNRAKIAPIGDYVDVGVEGGESSTMIVVMTEGQDENGAAALFYPGVLDYLYGIIGGDYYIIPSSRSEVLAIPVGTLNRGELDLLEFIKNTNAIMLEKELFLADALYKYDGYTIKCVCK